MSKIFDVVASILFWCWPFAVVVMAFLDKRLAAPIEVSDRFTVGVKKLAILTIPGWAPIFYGLIAFAQLKLFEGFADTSVSRVGSYLLFSMPLAWAISLLVMSRSPLLLATVLLPVTYAFGIFIMGVVGWVACGNLYVCR